MHFYCIERKQVDDGHGIINWLTDWLAGTKPITTGVLLESRRDQCMKDTHFKFLIFLVVTHGTQLHDESGYKGIIL